MGCLFEYWCYHTYSSIGATIPYLQHSTVNHSLEFVNRTDGTHTQNIESDWSRVKKQFKSMKGVNSKQLPSYLERYGATYEDAFNSILRDISLQYVV